MIIFFELSQSGSSHAPFTRAFLHTAAHAFPHEEMVIMGRASHLHAALDDTDPVLDGRLTKLAFEPPQSRRWPFLMSFWSTLSLLRSTWQRFAAHSPQIVFLTGEPAQMLAAKVFKRMAPGFHCHLVLHGDVNTIQNPRSRNPLRRVGDYSGAIRGRA